MPNPRPRSFNYKKGLPQRKAFVLDAQGLRWPNDGRGPTSPILEAQVETAKLFIQMWLAPSFGERNTVHKEGSYALKHDVEFWQRWCRDHGYSNSNANSDSEYVANGALIQALLDMEYWVKITPNCVNCQVYCQGQAWLAWRTHFKP